MRFVSGRANRCIWCALFWMENESGQRIVQRVLKWKTAMLWMFFKSNVAVADQCLSFLKVERSRQRLPPGTPVMSHKEAAVKEPTVEHVNLIPRPTPRTTMTRMMRVMGFLLVLIFEEVLGQTS